RLGQRIELAIGHDLRGDWGGERGDLGRSREFHGAEVVGHGGPPSGRGLVVERPRISELGHEHSLNHRLVKRSRVRRMTYGSLSGLHVKHGPTEPSLSERSLTGPHEGLSPARQRLPPSGVPGPMT